VEEEFVGISLDAPESEMKLESKVVGWFEEE